MDPCEHPEITHLVGFLSGFGKGPRPSKELYPVMAMSKTELHSDIVAISMEAWVEDVDNDPPWESKSNNKMLWRGKTTGIYFKDDVPWSELVHELQSYKTAFSPPPPPPPPQISRRGLTLSSIRTRRKG
jgi:hypothetical protein